jgi:hypothetical protein
VHFRAQEEILRKKDGEIKNSLIAFSSYLDVNQKIIKKCEDGITKLADENKLK